MKKVLITGGTGLVGKRLTEMLLERGYAVNWLTRSPKPANDGITMYQWDLAAKEIDSNAFSGVSSVIHLAGAGVADKKWTDKRKQEIIDSRVESTRLLHKYLAEIDHNVQSFVSASAVGFYGDRGDELLTEASSAGNTFLAEVVSRWEAEVSTVKELDIRTVLLRIGIVLSTRGGALKEMQGPIEFGLGSYLGNGKQYYSWIHIDDLCRMFVNGIESHEMNGVYNAAAPNPARNRDLIKAIAKAKGKYAVALPVPALALKLMMGEMAGIVLESTRVSSQKAEKAGFKFEYPELQPALQDLYIRVV